MLRQKLFSIHSFFMVLHMKSTIHIKCNIFNNFLITILIIAPLTEINLFLSAINAII